MERRSGGRSARSAAVSVTLVLAFVVSSLSLGGGSVGPRSGRAADLPGSQLPEAAPPPTNNISFASSVDQFPLSYYEWLPAGYSDSATYPIAVFLHGVGTQSAWVRGGVGGLVDITPSLADNASAYGFILLALNTRSSDGFYVDSPCGGPQQQDVLDAIAHESSLRHVGSVFLIGFSMGSLGSFSIAGHHLIPIAGVATAGSISDIYETIAFNRVTRSDPAGLYYAMCGGYPSPSNASVGRVWTYLSVLRFHPQNFSGIPLFVTGGGNDERAPNNFALWPYANVNSTFVNSTCAVASALGEPPNCTTTLHDLSPGGTAPYRWLDLYEPAAPHSTNQLPGSAVFSFFLDRISGGYYVSSYPGSALIPYTPGSPNPLPHSPSTPSSLPDWVWYGIGGCAVVAVVVGAIVVGRRPR